MKRVLFVATITKHINAFHIPYLKWFKEQGYEVHVASNGDEKIEYCDKHFNLPFERFPLKINNMKTYKELKKIINENQYEIIHSHTPVGGVLARLAARKARKKYGTKSIYTAHGFHFYKGAPIMNWIIYYPIEKICARWTDCLITINHEDYDLVKKTFKPKDVKLVHGVGMRTEQFKTPIDDKNKMELRHKIGLKEDDIVISYVAELNKNKNQILLLETIESLVKENIRYKLMLVGEGNKRSEYEQYIKNKELQENVFLLGRRNDVPQILSITDIYVATSIREGLGLNVVEAMQMNLPIIATDNRGHRELINSNNLINNKEELVNKIQNINSSMKEYNQEVQLYQIENVINEVVSVYMENAQI